MAARRQARRGSVSEDHRAGTALAVLTLAPIILSGCVSIDDVDEVSLTGDPTTPEVATSTDVAEGTPSPSPSPSPTATPPSTPEEAEAAAVAAGAVAHYPLEEGYESSIDGAPPLEPVNGTVELVEDPAAGGTAVEVTFKSGLVVDMEGLLDPEAYTIVVRFRLNSSATGYRKVIDVTGRTQDPGFYIHDGRYLYFPYRRANAFVPTRDDPYATLAFRRTADGVISWFVDGAPAGSSDDSGNPVAVITGPLGFFVDEVGGADSGSAARAAWISLYDGALSDEVIADL